MSAKSLGRIAAKISKIVRSGISCVGRVDKEDERGLKRVSSRSPPHPPITNQTQLVSPSPSQWIPDVY